MKILLITEQREGKWNKASFETLSAAQQIAKQTGGSLSGLVIGKGVAALADELAGYQLEEVLLVEHDLLEHYTPDGYSLALKQVSGLKRCRTGVAAAHLPSARFRAETGRLDRQRHDRRLHRLPLRRRQAGLRPADVSGTHRRRCGVRRRGAVDRLISGRSVSRGSDCTKREGGKAPVKPVTVDLKPEQIRTKPLELFREAKQAVDLTQAPLLVAIGRGHQGTREYSHGGETRKGARRGDGRIAADLR